MWWWLLGGLTTVIWTVVTIVSIFAPRAETGTDPTRIPVAAMLSPIIATVATVMLAGYVAVLSRTD